MPQNQAMGWVNSHPQDTNCDTNPFPSVLSWANFYSLYWNYPFQNQRWPPTLPKPMVDSQFSFSMTYWQHATRLSSCLHLKCFLYFVPRTPYTPLSAFLPAVSSHSPLCALSYLCEFCPEVPSILRSLPYYHSLSRSAVLKHVGLRSPLHFKN